MDKFIISVNRLISKGQARIVKRAAKILASHDKCDHLFFEQLKEELGLKNYSNVISVDIGDYVVARKKKPAEQVLCSVVKEI